jgi:hypothetical protein
MAYTRRILCLAASRKHGGLCYAGKDVETGEWIRPVSNRNGQEISDRERTLLDGSKAKVLDILEIAFLRAVPDGYQSENHLIDSSKKWKKVGEADWAGVESALDDHDGHSGSTRTTRGDFSEIGFARRRSIGWIIPYCSFAPKCCDSVWDRRAGTLAILTSGG